MWSCESAHSCSELFCEHRPWPCGRQTLHLLHKGKEEVKGQLCIDGGRGPVTRLSWRGNVHECHRGGDGHEAVGTGQEHLEPQNRNRNKTVMTAHICCRVLNDNITITIASTRTASYVATGIWPLYAEEKYQYTELENVGDLIHCSACIKRWCRPGYSLRLTSSTKVCGHYRWDTTLNIKHQH